jgi:ABC-type Fe3+/spermidine/putrescine transport system ATPase subunit
VGLTKLHGAARVVDAFSAAIPAGAFLSLLGPSGSGKTTTLMMLAGFVAADAGQILVGGATSPPSRRRSAGSGWCSRTTPSSRI